MKIEVTFQPVFHLPLTLADARLLCKLARGHHDFYCESAAKRGGFLHGWTSLLNPQPAEGPPETVAANSDQMLRVLRVLERRRSGLLDGHPDDLARADFLWNVAHHAFERCPVPASTTINPEEKASA